MKNRSAAFLSVILASACEKRDPAPPATASVEAAAPIPSASSAPATATATATASTTAAPSAIAAPSASAATTIADAGKSLSAQPADTSCKADDDCVPVRAAGCCPAPCTSFVISKRDQARVEAQLTEQCKKENRPCVSAGGCRTHEYLCVRSKCALVYEGDKDFRKKAP